jgi:hypothetical protein
MNIFLSWRNGQGAGGAIKKIYVTGIGSIHPRKQPPFFGGGDKRSRLRAEESICPARDRLIHDMDIQSKSQPIVPNRI